MAYRIEPIKAESSQIFTNYFGHIEFDHAPEWSTCYCRFYHTVCDQDEWMMRTGETNKMEADKDTIVVASICIRNRAMNL